VSTDSDPGTDPVIERLRERLTELDVRIVDAFNTRLELVAELKAVKAGRGLGFLDPAREEWLREHLAAANRGPLSPEGLRELHGMLLDLTKREIADQKTKD
jgi:chorismate mutase